MSSNNDRDTAVTATGVTHSLAPEVADKLHKIRAILFTAAQQLGVEIPTNTTSDLDFDLLKPKDDSYDQGKVVQYHLEELPPKDTVINFLKNNSGIESAPQDIFRGKELSDDLSTTDTKGIFDWGFDSGTDFFANIKMRECGYDSQGNVCQLSIAVGSSIIEHIFLAPQDAKLTPTWEKQIFGREWFITCEDLSPPELYAVLQFRTTPSLNTHHIFDTLFDRFTKPWPSLNICGKGVEWIGGGLTFDTTKLCTPQYHVRYFTGPSSFIRSRKANKNYVAQRVIGIVSAPDGREMKVTEQRICWALKTTTAMDLPIFTLINLSDSIPSSYELDEVENWRAANIRPWIRGTGIAAFAFRIYSMCECLAEEWTTLLNGIDAVLKVDLEHILSHEQVRKIMFDDAGSEFALSEFYFQVLQLLRIVSRR